MMPLTPCRSFVMEETVVSSTCRVIAVQLHVFENICMCKMEKEPLVIGHIVGVGMIQ